MTISILYSVLSVEVFSLVSINTIQWRFNHALKFRLVVCVVAVSNHVTQGILSVHDLAPQNC